MVLFIHIFFHFDPSNFIVSHREQTSRNPKTHLNTSPNQTADLGKPENKTLQKTIL